MRAFAILVLGFLAGSSFEHAYHADLFGSPTGVYSLGWKMFFIIGAYQVWRLLHPQKEFLIRDNPSRDKPRSTGNN